VTHTRFTLACLVAAVTAAPALMPGDVAVADAAWEGAQAEGWPLSDPRYLDVLRYQKDVAPWQSGAARCRRRAHAIEAARRDALPHDRGGRRFEDAPGGG